MSSTLLWIGCVVIFVVVLYTVITDKTSANTNSKPEIPVEDKDNTRTLTKIAKKKPLKKKQVLLDELAEYSSAEKIVEDKGEEKETETTLIIEEIIEDADKKDKPEPIAESLTDVDIDESKLQELEEYANVRKGRGGYDPEADRILSNSKYKKRQRNSLIMVGIVLLSIILGFTVSSKLFLLTLFSTTILGLYLVYLRQAVNLEESIRKQRIDRLRNEREKAIENGFEVGSFADLTVSVDDALYKNLQPVALDEQNPDFVNLPSQASTFQFKPNDLNTNFKSAAG